MKDMIAVLLQCDVHPCFSASLSDGSTRRLGSISDPKQVAPDGQTLEGQMETLCVAVADDIEKCAYYCNVYFK